MSFEALQPALLPLSWLYGAAARARNRYYETASVKRLPAPVVSIGNLTVGGSGKTPLVEAFARVFVERGLPVAVLSRGYGRASAEPFVLVSDGASVLASPRDGGDEPVELAEKVPGLAVAVGPDRYRVGLEVLDRLGPRVVLLDDGFQHRKLARDLDVVCFDVSEPAGSLKLLPAGRLREPLSGIGRADVVVWTGGEGAAPEAVSRIVRDGDIPSLRGVLRVAGFRSLGGGETLPPEAFHARPVGLVVAVARPSRIEAGLDAEIVHRERRRDHHAWSVEEVRRAAEAARDRGAEALVTTGKDAVKWRALGDGRGLAVPAYEIQARMSLDDRALVDVLVDRVSALASGGI